MPWTLTPDYLFTTLQEHQSWLWEQDHISWFDCTEIYGEQNSYAIRRYYLTPELRSLFILKFGDQS